MRAEIQIELHPFAEEENALNFRINGESVGDIETLVKSWAHQQRKPGPCLFVADRLRALADYVEIGAGVLMDEKAARKGRKVAR